MSNEKYKYRAYLVFYADLPDGRKNVKQKWEIPSVVEWRPRLTWFIEHHYSIRAAWLQDDTIDLATGEVKESNSRIEQSEILAIIDELIAQQIRLRPH
jgi:hypothetical protein